MSLLTRWEVLAVQNGNVIGKASEWWTKRSAEDHRFCLQSMQDILFGEKEAIGGPITWVVAKKTGTRYLDWRETTTEPEQA